MLNNQTLSSIISAGIGLLLISLGVTLFPSKEKKAGNDPEDSCAISPEGLKSRLVCYMESEKPYLAPDYTLEKAASYLGTNRTYLSILINSQFGVTFREYINRLRIEHAKNFILENSAKRLEDVAIASGFNTGSQFSRKFKEIEGISPNAWIRSRIQ